MISFDASRYEFTHGRRPSGYGVWGFEIHAVGYEPMVYETTGLYSEAKAKAKKAARERFPTAASVTITVLS